MAAQNRQGLAAISELAQQLKDSKEMNYAEQIYNKFGVDIGMEQESTYNERNPEKWLKTILPSDAKPLSEKPEIDYKYVGTMERLQRMSQYQDMELSGSSFRDSWRVEKYGEKYVIGQPSYYGMLKNTTEGSLKDVMRVIQRKGLRMKKTGNRGDVMNGL